MAIRGAIRPVVMSAVSSILAGAVMLFAETHAFFQVENFNYFTSFARTAWNICEFYQTSFEFGTESLT